MRKVALSFFVVLSQEEILLVAIGPLLAILSFLPCRSAAVGASDIFLFLGLGLYLAVVLLLGDCNRSEERRVGKEC